MAQAFITAKSILVSYNLTAPTNESGQKFRGTAHEFQDYAYRLASDLNDLEHLQIYMKLAKKYPRYILEDAYSSIADIEADTKGRLFMWKLKQMRLELENKAWLKNFNQSFINKKMSELRDKLVDSILKKATADEEDILKVVKNLDLTKLDNKKKVLFLGASSPILNDFFQSIGCKIQGIEIGKKLASKISESNKFKIFAKDFLSKTLKNSYFNYIFVYRNFEFISLDEELNYLNKLKDVVKPNGKIVLILSNISETESQSWKEITVKGEPKFYFSKQNIKENLIEKIINSGLKLKTISEQGKFTYFELTKF